MAFSYEIRFHGRGGQGAVTAANILAVAFFKDGRYVQSFPIFGTERRGAPVASFVRVDEKPITIRSQIYAPDVVVILDLGVIESVDVTKGLKKNGLIVLNAKQKPENLKANVARIAIIDATSIAIKHGLGSAMSPIVNTAILGAYAKAAEKLGIGAVSFGSLINAVRENAPSKPDENVAAVKEAYENTVF